MSSQKIRAKCIAALEKQGRVTPDVLLAAAKSKSYPLHGDFIWDDKIAGHKYRVEQAREIIASVRVMTKTTKMSITAVGYVRDPRVAGNKQGYVSVAALRDDRAYAEEALDAEVDRIKSLLDRAREFAEIVGLRAELETALQSIMRLHSRSRRGAAGVVNEERVSA